MTFTIKTQNGAMYGLPEPFSWRVSQSLGLPCGGISLCFLAGDAQVRLLAQAETITAADDNRTVFHGVVDGFQLTADSGGRGIRLHGRSVGARLQDNTAAPASFAAAHWSDLTGLYVTPLGVPAAPVSLPVVRDFKVESQCSVWQVLCDFTELAGAGQPAVTPAGTLTVVKPGQNVKIRLEIEDKIPALAKRFVYDRYDVIAQVTVRNRDTPASYVLKNSRYTGPLGRRQVLTGVGADGVAAMERAARKRMAESMRRLVTGQITLPGGFLASAGDVVTLSHEPPPFDGDHVVWLSETVLDGDGLVTRLELVPVSAFL